MSSYSARLLSLIPFGYALRSRHRTARDFAYLIASSWIPAAWLLWRTGPLSPLQAVGAFALGYLAFVSVYELGYLANDAWDARKSTSGRDRLGFTPGPIFITSFAAIRLLTWGVIAWTTGWLNQSLWLAGYAALAIVLVEHNLLESRASRLASFLQLAILRFLLPIAAALDPRAWGAALAATILQYAYLRFLAYADSKDLLNMPERRDASFGPTQRLLMSPLIFLIAYALSAPVLVELHCYWLVIASLWWRLAPRRDSSDPGRTG
jgi:hypothetical protein